MLNVFNAHDMEQYIRNNTNAQCALCRIQTIKQNVNCKAEEASHKLDGTKSEFNARLTRVMMTVQYSGGRFVVVCVWWCGAGAWWTVEWKDWKCSVYLSFVLNGVVVGGGELVNRVLLDER